MTAPEPCLSRAWRGLVLGLLLALLAPVMSGCLSTGRTLQHTPGHLCDWFSLHPEAEAMAWRRLADQRIAELCELLALPRPKHKVQIRLFPEAYSSNRYIATKMPQRVGVASLCFVDHTGYHIVITQMPDEEQTRASLRHELLHFVLINQFYDLPPWIDEGLAQLLEQASPTIDWRAGRWPGVRQCLTEASSEDWAELLAHPLSQPLTFAQYELALGLTWLLWHEPGQGVPAIKRYLGETHAGEPALHDFARHFDLSPAALPAWVAARLPPQ